jgi:large subunit ribosomal protein L30
MAETKQLAIKLVRSPIGHPRRQKATLRALGLRKMHQTVVHADTPQIRGMVNRVQHLVEVSPS